MTTGQKIRSARERKNMTQSEVAKLCHTTKQTIFKYENDIVTNIPYEKIILLSKALDVSIEYLFESSGKKDSPSEQNLTEGEKMMLELFRKIPVDRQPEALDLLRVALKMQQRP
jgi:transcriptional regulator with XRE-family HTH domain